MKIYLNYFKWCLLHPLSILQSLKKKLIKLHYGRYNHIYYPQNVLNLVNKYINNTNKYNKIKNDSFYKIKHNFLFNKDSEIFEKYHRFEYFIEQKGDKQIFNRIKKWYKIYLPAISNYKNSLIWESYTVSYRIVNAISISIKLKNDVLKDYIKNEVIFLLQKLEYFHNGISNHILKNSQAIIYAGVFFKDNQLMNIGFKILFSAEKKLINNEGLLRESSSSYQLLNTALYLDLYIFLNKNKIKEKKQVFNTLKKMLNASNFFNHNNKLVKFGDLTPDKKTSYLEKKIFFTPFYKSYLLAGPKNKFVKKIGNFIKINKHNSNLFVKFNKKTSDNFPTHENEDNFHFNYFHKKNLILTGLNRYNYNTFKGALADSNNLLTINNYGHLINLSRFYHNDFIKSKNLAKLFNNKKPSLEINTNCFKFIDKHIKWKRNLIVNNNSLVISDSLKSSKILKKKIFLHFSPFFYIHKAFEDKFILKSKKKNITVCMKIKKNINTKIIKKITCFTESYGEKSKNISFIFENNKSKNFSNIIEIKII
jgi:hypothetical protein